MLALGVNVAVRVNPLLPIMVDRLPPLTTTSANVNVAPGSSENVNVIVAVSPLFRVDTLLAIATVAAVVSNT